MGKVDSGVYAVYENQFKINTSGRNGAADNLVDIADMESFSVSFDDNVEEWTPMTTEGWIRRFKTGKGLTISLAGKRHIGDAGNDYVAGLAFKSGSACNSELQWTFPNGDTALIPCVINVTAAGGDSTGVEPLEFDCMSDGKPTFTPAAS